MTPHRGGGSAPWTPAGGSAPRLGNRDSKPGGLSLNPGFVFGQRQNPGFGFGFIANHTVMYNVVE